MATREATSEGQAPRPANDGNRAPRGNAPDGLENQNVTRPAPPPDEVNNQRDRQQEREGLENRNVTRPGPVR